MSGTEASRPSFYNGHGFDRLSGPEVAEVRRFYEGMKTGHQNSVYQGNLFTSKIEANFPGSSCALPVNWLLMPDRKMDYVLLTTSPGEGFPVHVHGYGQELYLIIRGEGIVHLDGDEYPAGAHDVFHIPAGMPHGYRVSAEAKEPLHLFAVNVPAVDHRLRSRYWAVPPNVGEAT
jgi:mannose-6-phosphate isomerase-like protein (cupin superfamily)